MGKAILAVPLSIWNAKIRGDWRALGLPQNCLLHSFCSAHFFDRECMALLLVSPEFPDLVTPDGRIPEVTALWYAGDFLQWHELGKSWFWDNTNGRFDQRPVHVDLSCSEQNHPIAAVPEKDAMMAYFKGS